MNPAASTAVRGTVVRQVEQYIEDHYCERISLAHVAAALHYSASYLTSRLPRPYVLRAPICASKRCHAVAVADAGAQSRAARRVM